MKKLSKRFEIGTDNLQAFLQCTCPYIQCGCQDIYDPYSVNEASERDLQVSTDWQYLYINP